MLLDSTMQWKDEFDEPKKDGLCQKMIKADFNGAHIEVVKNNNKQIVGQKGIVAKETQRSFILIDKENKQRIILKHLSVFRVKLPYKGIYVDLWGDMLLAKGSERTKAKFKERGTLDLY